jgi:exodeoxyribonuclease-3
MKLATHSVNGINGCLPVLLRWLEQSQPDVVAIRCFELRDEYLHEAAGLFLSN